MASIKMLPATPVIGHMLLRPCQHGSVQKLHDILEETQKHLDIMKESGGVDHINFVSLGGGRLSLEIRNACVKRLLTLGTFAWYSSTWKTLAA